LLVAIASIALVMAAPVARAQYTSQLEEKTIPVGDFTGIEVAGDFEVTLTDGPCVAKVTVDKMLSPYIQVYVRGKVLHITYDSKAVPKDVRQLYKGRNAPKPVFRANITMPELSSIFLGGNAVLNCADVLECKLTTDIEIQDKAQLKNLNIKANSVNVSMKKAAQAAMNIEAVNKAELKTEGNANLRATVEAHDLVCSAVGQSELAVTSRGENANLSGTGGSKSVITFEGDKAVVNLSGSASLNLSGKGENLSVRADKNSSLEAAAFDTRAASVDLNGSVKANITVSDSLDANLVGGSTLYYTGDPAFKIGKIVKSTLAPYGSSSR
ncbi:MAG: DUF2807 domain-containing protein, partial [Bacteroidales bacterium]|nr:DUF2807 domain-containing protein [Bacteroidales bacterium]